MIPLTRSAVLLWIVCLLGCSNADVPALETDFTWLADQKCSDPRSPAITVSGAPPNAVAFRVRMMDLTNMHDHGGGTVPNDHAGLIPAGALADYLGPCPFWGAPRYQVTVEALDQAGTVVAMGQKTRRWPPEE